MKSCRDDTGAAEIGLSQKCYVVMQNLVRFRSAKNNGLADEADGKSKLVLNARIALIGVERR
jgi:hypothetical protein